MTEPTTRTPAGLHVAADSAGMPDGYLCKKCGRTHKFNRYVYAHWSIELTHQCPCGAEVVIRRGVARSFPPNAPSSATEDRQ